MKKCNKCGIEYPDSTNFCSKCGGQVTSAPQVKTYKLLCKSCGGTMTIENENPVLVCPFCGSKELIVESDAVTVERIKQKTHKEIEMGKQQLERERMQHNDRVAEEQKRDKDIRKFKKSFLGIMLIIITLLSALFCEAGFYNSSILSGIIAIIMGLLCITSYLMGIHVIKESFNGLHILLAILAFILIFPYFSLFNVALPSHKDNPANLEWDILEMHDYIPEPPSTYGTIGLDYDNHLSVDVYKVSYAEYKEYRNKCIDLGYDKDTSGGGDTYYAYNDEGFSLNLYYYKNDERLGITLRAPEEETETSTTKQTTSANVSETNKATEKPTNSPTEPATQATKAPTSKYEIAFVRNMNDYDLYYMFDTDKKEVIYFGTNDTGIQEGTYSSNFSSGVEVNWTNYGYSEKFSYKESSSKATLTDSNGFDWEYKVCNIEDAQKVLDSIK